MSENGKSALAAIRSDVNAAMKAGDRERAGALRMIADSLQQDAKFGADDEVATLQRERKKRLEAAEAYEGGGRAESAASERREAELIAAYLPEQLDDDGLEALITAAIEETGATGQKEMGQVIGLVMGRAEGRADGKRVSQAVRERLGS